MIDCQNTYGDDIDKILDTMMILSESPTELLQYQTHMVNLNTLFNGNQAEYTQLNESIQDASPMMTGQNKRGGQSGGTIKDDICTGRYLDETDDVSKQLIAAFGNIKNTR